MAHLTDIGQRIRELRETRGMPKSELARRAGTTRNTLYRIESGRMAPSSAMVEQIAKGLNVDPGDLYRPPLEPPLLQGLEERLQADSPKDPQRWERALASVRERQSNVTAKVDELVETSAHSGEVDLHQVKRALDEAQGFQFTLMRAMSGASLRRSPGRVEIVFDPFAPEFDPAQWDEVGNAMRFYDDIVDRLVKAGLAEWKERAGQKRELVPAGFGE